MVVELEKSAVWIRNLRNLFIHSFRPLFLRIDSQPRVKVKAENLSTPTKRMKNPKSKGKVVLILLSALLLVGAGTVVWLIGHYLQFDKRIEILASFLSGIVGTAVGAFLAFRFAKLQLEIQSNQLHEKTLTDTSFEMLRIFESREMLEARGLADEVLQKYLGERFDSLDANHPDAETRAVWTVLSFYKCLWLMIQHSRVEPKLVTSLLAETFYWWYINYYEDRLLPVDWEVRDHIEALKKWFDNNLDENTKAQHIKRAKLDIHKTKLKISNNEKAVKVKEKVFKSK